MSNNSSIFFYAREGGAKPDLSSSVSKTVGSLPVNGLKSILIITLFAITVVCSSLPFALRRAAIDHNSSARRRHLFTAIFSFLSCFGGGVFLATCLLDLLPDTKELIDQGLSQLKISNSFPLAEFLVAIGFFLVLFIEQIVLWYKENHAQPHLVTAAVQSQTTTTTAAATPNADEERYILPEADSSTISVSSNVEAAPIVHVQINETNHHNENLIGRLGTINGVPSPVDVRKRRHSHPKSNPKARAPTRSTEAPETADEATAADHEDDASIAASEDVHFDPDAHSTFRALMLVLALSCHATFEGLALGLQADAAVALQIFGALCIHKAVISFSIGMRLVQSRLTTLAIVACCILFSASTAAGGFVGLAISEAVQNTYEAIINGSLQGIACGTFLYVTAFEILPHELNDGQHRMAKLLMLLLGFASICIFVLLYPS